MYMNSLFTHTGGDSEPVAARREDVQSAFNLLQPDGCFCALADLDIVRQHPAVKVDVVIHIMPLVYN